ncbi:MAG: hypothetical protein G01um101433_249 [Parcubacteria group bacterium Gr01-1014_33]|nr:MAG: hypothetical protein G01um101433_249 [Parcubacteria group bacterium Gr01-1014_33]
MTENQHDPSFSEESLTEEPHVRHVLFVSSLKEENALILSARKSGLPLHVTSGAPPGHTKGELPLFIIETIEPKVAKRITWSRAQDSEEELIKILNSAREELFKRRRIPRKNKGK